MQLPVPPITGFHTLLILRTISGLFLLLSSLWTLMSRNSFRTALFLALFLPFLAGAEYPEWSWVDIGLLEQKSCFQLLWADAWRGAFPRVGKKVLNHSKPLDAMQMLAEGCWAGRYPDLVRNLTAATQVAELIVHKNSVIQGGKPSRSYTPKLTLTTVLSGVFLHYLAEHYSL